MHINHITDHIKTLVHQSQRTTFRRKFGGKCQTFMSPLLTVCSLCLRKYIDIEMCFWWYSWPRYEPLMGQGWVVKTHPYHPLLYSIPPHTTTLPPFIQLSPVIHLSSVIQLPSLIHLPPPISHIILCLPYTPCQQVLTADADKAIQPYQRSSGGVPPIPKHVEACRRLYPFRQPIGSVVTVNSCSLPFFQSLTHFRTFWHTYIHTYPFSYTHPNSDTLPLLCISTPFFLSCTYILSLTLSPSLIYPLSTSPSLSHIPSPSLTHVPPPSLSPSHPSLPPINDRFCRSAGIRRACESAGRAQWAQPAHTAPQNHPPEMHFFCNDANVQW